MIQLKKSGLPLYYNNETNRMALEAPLVYQGFGHKVAKDMEGLLCEKDTWDDEEPFYDVYRKIRYPEHEMLLDQYGYQYDITIVMPGLNGKECKKTSGHYHDYNRSGKNTHPEVYEVISGTAWYILQKAMNFNQESEKLKVEDIIIAEVKAGQTIIVPPNYGHCSVNVGSDPLIFSNLAYALGGNNYYEPVKQYHGMGVYVVMEEGKPVAKINENYPLLPQVKFATVTANPKLGIEFGNPVYQSFLNAPEAFTFLGDVDNFVEEIMSMLHVESVLE